MRILLGTFFILILFSVGCEEKSTIPDLTIYVNPFVGTGGHGHTFPGATVPFGSVQLSPDTRLEGWDGCGGYHYSDSVIFGFSHTHLSGTGVSDYGDILFMPTTGTPLLDNGSDDRFKGYASLFSHSSETAEAGYYSTELLDYKVFAELTATTRTGIHRYTFRDTTKANIILDLAHRDKVIESGLQVISPTEIVGFRKSQAWAQEQHVYFVAKFSKPIVNHGIRLDSVLHPGLEDAIGKDIRAWFRFDLDQGEQVLVKVGISAVDIEGARKNLTAEVSGFNFNQVRKDARRAWNEELSRILVESANETEMRKFYTAMYHSMIAPNVFHDVDGRYRGRDLQIHHSKDHQNHTVFSLWDTFRATHPLFTIIQQRRTNDFIKTMLKQYEEGGSLPVWELAGNETMCMIGYHSVPVIADAYMKGIRDYDEELALNAMVNSAQLPHLGLPDYIENGYIGAGNESESVSKTLEYAYDDWCISIMAEDMGHESIANEFRDRAGNYRNLFDPKTNFFRAKQNGSWVEPFAPEEVNFHFTEANAWQYSLFVPQDIAGLTKLLGGPKGLENHLDSLFTVSSKTSGRDQADITGLIGQYAHGNEPSHHMAYLYNFTDRPEKGARILSQIMKELYSDAPDGLSGNEDCGQMSSWYVLSAIGIYPVTPGDNRYWFGAPQFSRTQLNLENGVTTILETEGEGSHVVGVIVDGKYRNRNYILHEELMAGGTIKMVLGKTKRKSYDSIDEVGLQFDGLPSPYFRAPSHAFRNEMMVEIGSAEAAEIFYTLDGTNPDKRSNSYSEPFKITETTTIKAISFSDGKASRINHGTFHKIDPSLGLKLNSRYEPYYAAGGYNALIDGLRGGNDFKTGLWQGYREDMNVMLNLGRARNLEEVSIGFLQDIKSWIWMPRKVTVQTSMDGVYWAEAKVFLNIAPEDRYGSIVKRVVIQNPGRCRFIKIEAEQYGVCPDWHLGAGGKTWIFADEIEIK